MMIWGPKTSKRCGKVVGKSSFYYHQDRPTDLETFFCRALFDDRAAVRENDRNSRANRHPRKNNKSLVCNSQLGEERCFLPPENAKPEEVRSLSFP
jgi:hypothetical protein